MAALDRLLAPRSIALVGASADATKLTGRPLHYLKQHGFRGAIYPVNPRAGSIAGLRCYSAIAALPETPDVALVLLGGERVLDAIRQLSETGTGAAVVLASGFGETGEKGRRQEDEIRRAAGAMRVLGPNSIGLINVTDGIALTASNALVADELLRGSVALVSQSGGILGSLLSRAQAQGIGFSKLVATGNECDLDVSDFVSHLAGDPATNVIALYLEGLRHPQRFREAALKARAAGKPIVAFKVGRSEAGARAAVSHTGAMAGSDAVYDALFRQLHIIRAERFSDLLDLPMALSARRTLQGRRLAVVTSTGGAASLLADAAGGAGFELPEPDASTAQRLRALDIPGASLDRNPIDVTLAGVKPEVFRSILDALLDTATYDAIAVVLGSSVLRDPEVAGGPLREAFARAAKPIVGFVSPDAPHVVDALNRVGVPTFAAPESCAAALSAMWRVSQKPAATEPARAVVTSDDVRALLRPGALNEAESKALFKCFGIPAARDVIAGTAEEAQRAAGKIGGNVVVKILSHDVLHKTDVGGVTLDVAPAEVAAVCTRMAESFTAKTGHKPEGFLMQERITSGVEMILGLRRDPQFGPLILLGMGGTAAELMHDVSLRLAPVSRRDAREMIEELKTSALLKGYRGRTAADLDALVDAIVAFSDMGLALADALIEAEINPLFVLPKGQGVIAADGLAVGSG
jgi:acetate---CoA ligase (ADP-forming)